MKLFSGTFFVVLLIQICSVNFCLFLVAFFGFIMISVIILFLHRFYCTFDGLFVVLVFCHFQIFIISIFNLFSFIYGWQPNSIILAISPANQDIATSDAIKLAREVDPSGNLLPNLAFFLLSLF